MDPHTDPALSGQLAEAHDAFVTALINNGVMGKLRAQLRVAALAIVKGDQKVLSAVGSDVDVRSLPLHTRIALTLVDEFLSVKNMKHAHGLFQAESNIAALEGQVDSVLRSPIVSYVGQEREKSSPSLLEALVAAALAGPSPAASSAAASVTQRAPSPDIEMPAATTATAASTTSAVASTSQPSSRRNSISASNAAEPYEDSIEYSDHSANSSLTMDNCVSCERIAAGPKDAESSEDDF